MTVLNLFNFLSSTINQGPKVGETRYYHDNSIFKDNITACGDTITCGNSLVFQEAAICGNVYITKNPIEKNPIIPNLFVSGSIFGSQNLSITGTSIFNNLVTANQNVVINGRLMLAGCGDVATQIEIAKTLPSPSDKRLKENIHTITDPISKVCSLRGVSYDLIKDKKKQIGVIAQEIEQVIPEVVADTPDGYKGVHYGNLVGLLIEAIKDQQKQIDDLTEQLERINERIN